MLYEVMHGTVPPLMRAIWRPTVIGRDRVPETGGVIIASNHLSFVDSVAIPSVVKRKVVFLTKSDYFTGSGVKGFLSRAFFEGLGMLPVDRDDSKAAIQSLETALEVLGRGDAFGIYPEGTRSRDGTMSSFKPGLGMLVAATDVPVIPCHLEGAWSALPPGKRFPRPRRITLRVGEALRFDTTPDDRHGWVEVAARAEEAVRKLGS